jgi:hypothetical protein
MTDIYNDELFNGGDFVFNRMIDEETGESTIVGGGYKINSFFLQSGLPAMTTLNSPQQTDGKVTGGKVTGGRVTGGKVSSPFENLAVPAGLFYINQRVPKNDLYKPDHHYKEHEMLSDDMIDKLFGLVEADNKKKRKSRKHINKSDNKKSRKRH